jgi:hypothetical protein
VAAGGRVLDRVGEEVGRHLLEALPVQPDIERALGQEQLHVQALVGRHRTERDAGLAQGLAQVDALQRQHHLPGFEPRDLHQIAGQLREHRHLGQDDVGGAADLRHLIQPPDDLRRGPERRQRIAQLMAQRAQEAMRALDGAFAHQQLVLEMVDVGAQVGAVAHQLDEPDDVAALASDRLHAAHHPDPGAVLAHMPPVVFRAAVPGGHLQLLLVESL